MAEVHFTRMRGIIMALLCSTGLQCLGVAVMAADEATLPPNASQTPPIPQPEPQNPTLDLIKVLPSVPSIVVKDNAVYWQDGGKASFQIVDVVQSEQGIDPIITSPVGKIQVTRNLIADNRTDLLSQLPQLVAQAKAAGLEDPAARPRLRIGIMTGLQLSWNDSRVIAEGVLKRAAIAQPNRNEDRDRLQGTVKTLINDLAHTDLDDLGKRCLQEFLATMLKEDAERSVEEILPSQARRMARCGWLRQFYPAQDVNDLASAEQDVVQAEKFLPVTLFEGAALRFAEVKDAFSREGWTLVTPTRTAYMIQHQVPAYYQAWPEEKPFLVVDLPPGSDPTLVCGNPLSAHLYRTSDVDGAEQIASWTRDKPLSVNRDSWRAAIPAKGRKMIDVNAVTDFMPPHILVTALNGDIIQLVVEGGVVVPPTNGSDVEGERFLADAAKVLPDPASLDLIGEYLLRICCDSPDSRHPDLLGIHSIAGDSHQTATQTIQTACAGTVRGDSDDLAELYQTIAQRQGRTAHLIATPRHAAMAFAEKKEDGNWHAYLLHASPPCEFTDARLPVALEKAYSGYDNGIPFDANSLGLLLRFSGENTRSVCRLSWRVFSEPEYAKTMIDVQSDCHFQTYSRAIREMKKLIANDTQDSANYQQLAELYRLTGQYDKAVENRELAISHTTNDVNRLELSVGLVQLLFTAHQSDRARQVGNDLIDQLHTMRKDADLTDRLDAPVAQLGARFAEELCQGRAFDLALRALKATQLDYITARIKHINELPLDPTFARVLTHFIPSAIAVLRGYAPRNGEAAAANPDVQAIESCVQEWLDRVAFMNLDKPTELMAHYASAGQFYGTILGDDLLMTMIDGAGAPVFTQHARVGGVTQMQEDIPWIRYSVPFWSERLMRLVGGDSPQLDKNLVLKLGGRVAEALAMSAQLGLDNPAFHHQAHLCAVIAALIGRDAKALRELMHVVRRSGDRSLREDTAQWLGDAARHLDLAWYQQVMQIWKDEIDDPLREYQLKYLWIAWRAALHGAPRQALLVAKMAASELKDPAYGEEYDYLQSLPDQAAAASEAAHVQLTPVAPAPAPPASGAPATGH